MQLEIEVMGGQGDDFLKEAQFRLKEISKKVYPLRIPLRSQYGF